MVAPITTTETPANPTDVANALSNPNAATLTAAYGYNPLPGANSTTPPTPTTVTSSDPSASAVGNLGSNISNAATNPPVLPTPDNSSGTYNPSFDATTDPATQAAITAANQPLTDRETQLQQERDAELAELANEQNQETTKLQGTQTAETATTNRNLLYLQQGGQSASAQAYLNNLATTHQQEMDTLTAKYNSAILQAKQAYDDNDFKLAQEMVQNASDIRKAAQDRNQAFLDNTLKIRQAVTDQAKFDYEQTNDAKNFAVANRITSPFYTLDGKTVINTATGQLLSDPSQYLAQGGAGDFSDVQQIYPTKNYAPGVIGEWQAYNEEMTREGAKPIDLPSFVNLRRPTSTTNIYSGNSTFSTSQISDVKAILDANPGDEAAAIKAVNSKIPNGASMYDSLIKQTYELPAAARSAASSIPANVSLSDWNTARALFIQQNDYVDPDTAGATWDKTVPKPGAKSTSLDVSASINNALNNPTQ